jgi:hypothetical protein
MPPIFVPFDGASRFLPSVGTALKAALWATVHISFSTSYLSMALGLLIECIGIFFLLHDAKPAGMRGWRMVKAWCKSAFSKRDRWIVLGLGLFFFLAPFFVNFWKAMHVFVWNHPYVQATWQQEDGGFEMMPSINEQITPSYLRDHKQYVMTIDYAKTNTVPASLQMLFQFPYPVDHWMVNTYGDVVSGTFSIDMPLEPVIINNNNLTISGEPHYLNWVLKTSQINPGGRIRLVVILNNNAEGEVASMGKSGPNNEPPPTKVANLSLAFVDISTKVTFGGQSAATEAFAPFYIDENKVVSLGNFGLPPNPLPRTYKVF